ncbi:hypothetical protein TRVL_08461 [Trypanosoma vivax]|nr:hypothetical protein TRVL_08461 [Trypanosoma vivax]
MQTAATTRVMLLRAVAKPEWDPKRGKLRVFYLALGQAKVWYGACSWWSDASVSDRERQDGVQAQAAHIVAGIPAVANREDFLREACLETITDEVHRRESGIFPAPEGQ